MNNNMQTESHSNNSGGKPPWAFKNHRAQNNNSYPYHHSSYIYYPQPQYSQVTYYTPSHPTYYTDPHNSYYPPSNHYQQQHQHYEQARHQHTTYYSNPYTKKQDSQNVNTSIPFEPTIYEPITTQSNFENSPDKLPRIIFQGEIIIVNSIEKVKPALAALFKDGTAMAHGIGFDMEWKPNFGKGSPRNPTSLIQLSTDKVCVIFWMMHLEHKMPLELFEVLASPDVLKIGQSLDSGDNERLSHDFHLMLTNSVDISILAKRKGFAKTNLKEQTKVLLGKNLSKFLCTSNWADIRLTPAQIRYAATDPYVTFLIYHKLKELPDAPLPIITVPYDGEAEEGGQYGEDTLAGGMSSLSINPIQPEMTLSVKCPHCDRFFMKKVQLYAHLDTTHPDYLPRGPQTCSFCFKQFKKYSALKLHEDMTGHATSDSDDL